MDILLDTANSLRDEVRERTAKKKIHGLEKGKRRCAKVQRSEGTSFEEKDGRCYNDKNLALK